MKIGSLCSGAGMLDVAVGSVFDAETVWHCENDSAASAVLAKRWPGIPNHGDLVATDWNSVEPVDIICAGWPCQPFSLAGKQKGHADERAIWPHIATAIRTLRPQIVVLENVPAVRKRELTRVADTLAQNGYDFSWICLRASVIGAPHRRERLFIVAHTRGVAIGQLAGSASTQETGTQTSNGPGNSGGERPTEDGWTPADTESNGRDQRWAEPARLERGSDAAVSGNGSVKLLPTPVATDAAGTRNSTALRHNKKPTTNIGDTLTDALWKIEGRTDALLPTPRAHDAQGPKTSEQIETMRSKGHGIRNLNESVIYDLLPTPATADGNGSRKTGGGDRSDELLLAGIAVQPSWGKYETAVRNWEQLTRPAPLPTEPNTVGNPRLSPRFSEWMMGWPEGWVTDLIDPERKRPPGTISRNDALRIIGNGVVPQQAMTAIGMLLENERNQ